MFNFKSQLLGVAAVLPVAAVVSFAGSAQAVSLSGSIGISGTAIIPSDGVNPLSTSIRFVDVDGVDGHGDFGFFVPSLSSNLPNNTTDITISTLNLTRTSILSPITAKYSTGIYTPFINFGSRTLNGVTANLTFDLDNTQVTRTRLSSSLINDVTLEGLTGKFNFNGVTIASGFLNASLAGAASSYELTLTAQPVPEPTTMLGLGLVAAGMTVARRRKLVKA